MLNDPVRLNMNEMPYPPPQAVIDAALKGLSDLNRYADPKDLNQLRGLLADYTGVSQRRIILSPGSDLLLKEIILTFSQGRKVIIVSPSFFPTTQTARHIATKLVSIRLSPPEFNLDVDLLMNELQGPCLVIVDNPNNPTGKILLNRQVVEAIIGNPDILLVIDEAYYEFSRMTFVDMVRIHANLAVTRTLDKAFSLAGARIGYGVFGEAFLEACSSSNTFLPRSSLYAALEALNHPCYVERNVQRVVEERERVWDALSACGVQAYPSSTNFLLVRTESPEMVGALRNAGVLISDLSNQLPSGFVRVSVGTREENDAFIIGYIKIREAYDQGHVHGAD